MTRAETLRKFKSVMRSQFAVADKHCSQCRTIKPRAGGRDVAYNGGLNQRWVCADCSANWRAPNA